LFNIPFIVSSFYQFRPASAGGYREGGLSQLKRFKCIKNALSKILVRLNRRAEIQDVQVLVAKRETVHLGSNFTNRSKQIVYLLVNFTREIDPDQAILVGRTRVDHGHRVLVQRQADHGSHAARLLARQLVELVVKQGIGIDATHKATGA
jgi:hypothetical protein